MNPDIDPAALYWATFNHVQFRIPGAAVLDICKSGDNADSVAEHLPEVRRLTAELYPEPGNPWEPTATRIREELAEHGTWDETELADEEANWSRLLWLGAWNVFEDDERDSSEPVPPTEEETPADLLSVCKDAEKLLSGLFRSVTLDGDYEQAVGDMIDTLRRTIKAIEV